MSPDRAWLQRAASNDSVPSIDPTSAPAFAERVKMAPMPGVFCKARTTVRDHLTIPVAHVDRGLAVDDSRRAVGKRARERFEKRTDIGRACVCREPMVRCHPDVVCVENARRPQAILYVHDFPIDSSERFDCRRMSHAQRVRRRVWIAEPHDRHRWIHGRETHFQERLDCSSIPRIVRMAFGGGGPSSASTRA